MKRRNTKAAKGAVKIATAIEGLLGLVHVFSDGAAVGHALSEICLWCKMRDEQQREYLEL